VTLIRLYRFYRRSGMTRRNAAAKAWAKVFEFWGNPL
jgi:hypothetical protein